MNNSLLQRTQVIVFLLPVALVAIYFGGLVYTLAAVILLGLAAWEYTRMFQAGGLQPSGIFILTGVILLVVDRAANGFTYSPLVLSGLVLGSLVYHMVTFERGRDLPATDFSVTLSGILYIGWIGAYFISLRNLPNGLEWTLITLPAVWLADGMAYFVGKAIGKHQFSPRLSPKKTWEGYWGGVIGGTLGGAFIAFLWQLARLGPAPVVTPLQGAILGVVLSLLTPLGDLGESMFKRQFGFKDSSNLLPGHGGIFDRIDSWLWAVVLAYYMVEIFIH
jgi:phosphatidate cytidylyltransferase